MPKRPELPPEPWKWDAYAGAIIDANSKVIAQFNSPSAGEISAAAPAALRVCDRIDHHGDHLGYIHSDDWKATVGMARAALAIAYPEPEQEKPLEKRLAKTLSTIRSMCIYGTYPEIDAILAECRQRGWLEE